MTRERVKQRVLKRFKKNGQAMFKLGKTTFLLINKENTVKYSRSISENTQHTYYITTEAEIEMFLNDYMKELKKIKIKIWSKKEYLNEVKKAVESWKGTGLKGGMAYLYINNCLSFKATSKNLLNYPC